MDMIMEKQSIDPSLGCFKLGGETWQEKTGIYFVESRASWRILWSVKEQGRPKLPRESIEWGVSQGRTKEKKLNIYFLTLSLSLSLVRCWLRESGGQAEVDLICIRFSANFTLTKKQITTHLGCSSRCHRAETRETAIRRRKTRVISSVKAKHDYKRQQNLKVDGSQAMSKSGGRGPESSS